MKPFIKQFFKYLEDTEGKKVPFRAKILHHKEFKFTPEDLKVKGDLNLGFTSITSLPDNLEVGGSLNLYFTPIISLPDNLKVRGGLSLENTKITSLPDNLSVGGNLTLSGTPVSKKYTAEEIKAKYNIGGEVIM